MTDKNFQWRFNATKAKVKELDEELETSKARRIDFEDHLWNLLKLAEYGKIQEPSMKAGWFTTKYVCPSCDACVDRLTEDLRLPTLTAMTRTVYYYSCSYDSCDYEYVREPGRR